MALTKQDLAAIRQAIQPQFDRIDAKFVLADENARKYRNQILTAVDAYKVLVKKYESELISLQGKYKRLATVLKRVAVKTGVKTTEL